MPPVDDGLREIGRHAGQVHERAGVGGVEIELGSLVHQPESGWVHGVARSRHPDEPEKGVAHRHGGALVRRRVGKHARGRRVEVVQDDFRVLFRAIDGGLGLPPGQRIVLAAIRHEHGVAEDHREAHQPQADHEHDDEHAAARRRAAGKIGARFIGGGEARRTAVRWAADRAAARRAAHRAAVHRRAEARRRRGSDPKPGFAAGWGGGLPRRDGGDGGGRRGPGEGLRRPGHEDFHGRRRMAVRGRGGLLHVDADGVRQGRVAKRDDRAAGVAAAAGQGSRRAVVIP